MTGEVWEIALDNDTLFASDDPKDVLDFLEEKTQGSDRRRGDNNEEWF